MRRSESGQRRRILDTSVAVFAGRGLKGATIRLIGKAAGVNSALIYYYFENKETLFAEAVRLVLVEFLTLLQDRAREFASPNDRIRFLVDGLFEYYSRHPDRMRMMTLVVAFHADLMAEVLSSFLREHRSLVPLEVIREGVQIGDLRPVAPIQVWWSLIGVCLFSLYARDVVDRIPPASLPFPVPSFEERKRAIVDLLSDGMVAQGADRKACR